MYFKSFNIYINKDIEINKDISMDMNKSDTCRKLDSWKNRKYKAIRILQTKTEYSWESHLNLILIYYNEMSKIVGDPKHITKNEHCK